MKASWQKWIGCVTPDDRVGDVAERALRNRLGAVRHYLPLAAKKADEDIEHVHQLRVWTRRAGTALRLYDGLMPRRRRRWFKRQLRRIRHSANEARDLDVLIERLERKGGESHWLEDARHDRKKVQRTIVAVHRRLRHDRRFADRAHELLKSICARSEEGRGEASSRYGEWARERLHPLIDAFLAAIPTDPSDETALHQFRIHGKELRYALELLEGAFPPLLRTSLYPAIEELQDRLGVLNDLSTSRDRLRRKIQKTRNRQAADSWRRLQAEEETDLEQARDGFWTWCTQSFLQGLREDCRILFAPPGAPRLAGDPASTGPPLERTLAIQKVAVEPRPRVTMRDPRLRRPAPHASS